MKTTNDPSRRSSASPTTTRLGATFAGVLLLFAVALGVVLHAIAQMAQAERDVATLERGPSGGAYANPGSWLDDSAFLEITENRVALRRWGLTERDSLHLIHRRTEKALPEL